MPALTPETKKGLPSSRRFVILLGLRTSVCPDSFRRDADELVVCLSVHNAETQLGHLQRRLTTVVRQCTSRFCTLLAFLTRIT